MITNVLPAANIGLVCALVATIRKKIVGNATISTQGKKNSVKDFIVLFLMTPSILEITNPMITAPVATTATIASFLTKSTDI